MKYRDCFSSPPPSGNSITICCSAAATTTAAAVQCARSVRLPPLVTAHRSPALCSSFISFLTFDQQSPHFLYAIEPSLRYTFLETVISSKGRKLLLIHTTLEATPAVHTAGALWIVIDNSAPAVKLQVTAFQQHPPQLLPCPLDTRFGT